MYRVTSGPQLPGISRDGACIRLSNQFWTVEHDLTRGGGPTSIRFAHGSGENLLAAPWSAHLGGYRPGRGRVFYQQWCDPVSGVETADDPSGPSLVITGDFRDELGETQPIRFRQRFHYRDWGHVQVSLTFMVDEELRTLAEISPCNVYLNRKINRFGVRHASGPGDVPSEPSIFWRDVTATRSWRSARSASINHAPLYWCALREEVEGIEFHRGADSHPWDCFGGLEPGHTIFTYERVADNRHFQVRNELFNTVDGIVIPPGDYSLEYHLGLPFIKPRDEVRTTYFHGRTRATDWPTRDDIAEMADAGIRVVRHHDDNVHRPKGWPDGMYPPYGPEDMQKLDRMIREMDEAGIFVVPYFSMKEFNPQCPAFAANAEAWARRTRLGTPVDGLTSCFGAYMCQRSGWVDYLKQSIDKVLSNHAFHGLYFDHLWPRECRHPDHCDGHQHSDVDAMIDFMKWARERVGSDGFLFTHDSRCPCMIFENMSDLMVIGEGNLQCAPQPGGIDVEAVFLPITTRHNVHGVQTDDDTLRYPFFVTMIQEGVPPNWTFEHDRSRQDAWMIDEYRKVAPYVTDPAWLHLPARRLPVHCPEGVFAAAFRRGDEAVLYVCNHHTESIQARLVPELLRFAYPLDTPFRVVAGTGESVRALGDILDYGLEVALSGTASELVTLSRTARLAGL